MHLIFFTVLVPKSRAPAMTFLPTKRDSHQHPCSAPSMRQVLHSCSWQRVRSRSRHWRFGNRRQPSSDKCSDYLRCRCRFRIVGLPHLRIIGVLRTCWCRQQVGRRQTEGLRTEPSVVSSSNRPINPDPRRRKQQRRQQVRGRHAQRPHDLATLDQ